MTDIRHDGPRIVYVDSAGTWHTSFDHAGSAAADHGYNWHKVAEYMNTSYPGYGKYYAFGIYEVQIKSKSRQGVWGTWEKLSPQEDVNFISLTDCKEPQSPEGWYNIWLAAHPPGKQYYFRLIDKYTGKVYKTNEPITPEKQGSSETPDRTKPPATALANSASRLAKVICGEKNAFGPVSDTLSKDKRKAYVIGSLRNPEVQDAARALRENGWIVFDDWQAAGPNADDHWMQYEKDRGHTFREALAGEAAQNVFKFDKRHLDNCDIAVLVLPAGKSGHLELGYIIGQGKPGYILMPKGEPERYDVMYNFATKLFLSTLEMVDALR